MRIQELLSQLNQPDVKLIQQDTDLLEAARTLCTFNIRALPVVDSEKNVLGIISKRDIVRSIVNSEEKFFQHKVKDTMTTAVTTCSPDDNSNEIYQTISTKKIRHIPVVENSKLIAMLSIRDFEKVREANKTQTLMDELTGLYNLRHLLSLLNSEFSQYRRFHSRFSVSTIIVNDYNQINTTAGYAAGDELLKSMADILGESTRAFDIIGRTADDQFVIIFRNTDRKTAIRACERVIKTVKTAALVPAQGMKHLSISVGLAIANIEDQSGISIMKRSGNLARSAVDMSNNCLEVDADNNLENINSAA